VNYFQQIKQLSMEFFHCFLSTWWYHFPKIFPICGEPFSHFLSFCVNCSHVSHHPWSCCKLISANIALLQRILFNCFLFMWWYHFSKIDAYNYAYTWWNHFTIFFFFESNTRTSVSHETVMNYFQQIMRFHMEFFFQ